MKAYKIFDRDWTCNDYKYKHTGLRINSITNAEPIKCCHNGFHACLNPHDLTFYFSDDIDNPKKHRYAIVDVYGHYDYEFRSYGSKIASKNLVVLKEYPTYEALLKEYDIKSSLYKYKAKLEALSNITIDRDIILTLLDVLHTEFNKNKEAVAFLFIRLARMKCLHHKLDLFNPLCDGGSILTFIAMHIHKCDTFIDEPDITAPYYSNIIRINNKIKRLCKVDLFGLYKADKKIHDLQELKPHSFKSIIKACSAKQRQLIMKGA